MKNAIVLILMALSVALAFASPEAEAANWGGYKGGSDWGKGACLKRAPNVQKAIERYCNKGDGFFVPSVKSGRQGAVGNARVSISGGCNPGQWLPWDICFKQFYSMCVSGNGRGENNRVYGNNNCQRWRIANPR